MTFARNYGKALADKKRLKATVFALFVGSADGYKHSALAQATWKFLK